MIYDISPVNNYVGNNSTTKFDFDFYIEDESQINVYLTNSNGEKTLLTYNQDYSINEFKNANGSYITYPITGSSHSVLSDVEKISIQLTLPISQETQYQNSSSINFKSLEYSFDYLTRIAQILARQLQRAAKIQEGSTVSPDTLSNNINKLADVASQIATLASNVSNIDNVASNISSVNSLAQIPNDISAVAQITSDITTVKNSISNINSVSGDLENINLIASDLDNIDAASTNATNAYIWSEGTDAQVQALGGSHSSKGWAQQSAQSQIQSDWIESDTTSKSYILNKPDLTLKQDALVSGTNIKTIENNSILGSGNLDLNLSNKASIDLSNLSATGEKHFLNKSQATNCILEAPQNIILELDSGVLTLKAGSKLIKPNGFEQDGTTPKFDEYTVESDIIREYTSSSSNMVTLYLAVEGASLAATAKTCSGGSDTISGTGHLWYDTTNNLVKQVNSSDVVTGNTYLPIGLITPVGDGTNHIASINQIFNGAGYIGSTLWVDKGVKYVIPNGKNEDGTLNNIEATTSKILTYTHPTSANTTYLLELSSDSLTTRNAHDNYYSPIANLMFDVNNGYRYNKALVGRYLTTNGVVSNFVFNQTLNFNDLSSGQWIGYSLQLANSVTSPSSANLTYDLSEYLPKDNRVYEVLVSATGQTGTTSGNAVRVDIKTSTVASSIHICGAQTRASSTVRCDGASIIPVGADKIITIPYWSSNTGTFSLWACAYRRLGTNI